MTSLATPTVSYDVDLMVHDMASKGLMKKDLAALAGVSAMAVTRFLRGEIQTPRMAKKLAGALGHGVRRYLASSRQAVA